MWVLFGLMVLVAIAVGVLKLCAERSHPADVQRPQLFEKAPPLFSPAERSFYGVLEQAIGNDYRIFAKVRLGDVIQPKKGQEKSSYYATRNMIDRKHLDYVVCGKTDFAAVGAIELDDKSHERQDRRERDDLVDRALDDAGIPILHFSVRTTYSVQDVRLNIANAFPLPLKELKQQTTGEKSPQAFVRQEAEDNEFRLSSGVGATEVASQDETKSQSPNEICPDCGSKMVVKKVSKGPHAGRAFQACIKYPQCKSIMPINQEIAAKMDF